MITRHRVVSVHPLFSILWTTIEIGYREIEMVVVAAAWIESCMTMRAAGIGLDIGRDGDFGAAGSAQDSLRLPFGLRPGFEGVVGKGAVAILAGIVGGAAFHLDGDDVEGGVVVEAAGLGVEV
jgi:hypothetical protein